QQGFPISEEMQEASDVDGQTYTVQYFQRAVFEMHPENAAPYDVLLSLLGAELYKSKYNDNAPGQTASKTNARTFPETGKTLGGVFRKYWEQHGGLAQQGYPISNEFQEKSATDGKTYTVQYFERAVFEYHPENAGKPSEVLLSLLGQFRLSGGTGGAGGTGGTPSMALNVPGWTHITVATNKVAVFYNSNTGVAITAKLEKDGSLTPLWRFPDPSQDRGDFGKGWNIMQAGPNSQVLLYASATGHFQLLKVYEGGDVSVEADFQSVAGFTNIMIDPVTGIMFYQNKSNGTVAMDKLFEDGTFINIIATGPAKNVGTDVVVTPMVINGLWYVYSPSSGQVNTYTINDRAEFVGASPPGNIGEGVTHIVSNYYNVAAFYNKSDRRFTTAKMIGPNGQPAQPQIIFGVQSEKSWSIIAATQSPIIICADDKGNIQTNVVLPDNGVIALVKTYDAGK
ncbi:MAG: hypothetical protein ABIQ44_13785, partial [Chloroflexia bacterium]